MIKAMRKVKSKAKSFTKKSKRKMTNHTLKLRSDIQPNLIKQPNSWQSNDGVEEDDDFNTFFTAYQNHKDLQTKTDKSQRGSVKSSEVQFLSCPKVSQGRTKFSFSLHKTSMNSLYSSKGYHKYGSDDVQSSNSYDIHTNNMLTVIDGLKQIVDEIEDDY